MSDDNETPNALDCGAGAGEPCRAAARCAFHQRLAEAGAQTSTAQARFIADRHVATAVKSPLTADQGARMEQVATYGRVFYDAISISVPFGPYYLQALEHMEMALMLAAKGIAHEQRILGREIRVAPCKCQSTLRIVGQASQCPRCGGEP